MAGYTRIVLESAKLTQTAAQSDTRSLRFSLLEETQAALEN
jgi:hypothetical protein